MQKKKQFHFLFQKKRVIWFWLCILPTFKNIICILGKYILVTFSIFDTQWYKILPNDISIFVVQIHIHYKYPNNTINYDDSLIYNHYIKQSNKTFPSIFNPILFVVFIHFYNLFIESFSVCTIIIFMTNCCWWFLMACNIYVYIFILYLDFFLFWLFSLFLVSYPDMKYLEFIMITCDDAILTMLNKLKSKLKKSYDILRLSRKSGGFQACLNPDFWPFRAPCNYELFL